MKLPSLLLVLCAPAAAFAADSIAPEQLTFFEKKIRPVLAAKCYDCHSAETGKNKGGLTLDTRDGLLRGGDSGPALVSGNPEKSLLIEAIRYQDSDLAMPPKQKGGKLADAVIKDFEAWVKMGAPDPRNEAKSAIVESSSKKWSDYEEATKWWSWQLPQKHTPPAPKDAAWAKTDLDRFILADLEKKNLKPVADADPATLLRRIYFDLIGLPARPQEVIDFVKAWGASATNPAARQKLLESTVDMLLASPQFGERWGRHWLDVARYAESSGKDANTAFPHAWRYRDYVIAAFNSDKPYDQFLREQIAGDLLPSSSSSQKAEQMVATGFLALGPKSLNEQNPRQYALDVADEQIDTISQSVLATTISCARCHDHKFDPIPQREYYSLAGIFLSTDTCYGTAAAVQNRRPSDLLELPTDAGVPILAKTLSATERERKEKELADLKAEQAESFRDGMAQRRQQRAAATDDKNTPAPPANANPQQRRIFLVTRIGQLEAELKSFDANGKSRALAMGVRDQPQNRQAATGALLSRRFLQRVGRPPEFSVVSDSAVYLRGDVDKPGDHVSRGFISVLSKGDVPPITKGTSGRKELADWLVSPGNPLTSRVVVNRVWGWLFGRGIVESMDNFGTTGKTPDHPELLDFLALQLRDDYHWCLKRLVREIILSRTYQLGSSHDSKNFTADPENALCWRMSKRRLDAECVRDAMLAVSSELNLTQPVGSVIARAGDGLIGAPRLRGISEESIVNPITNHRSIYLPIARDVLPEALALFDFAEPSLVTGNRDTTNVPSQALYLLNSDFVKGQAEKFAAKLLAAYPNSGPNSGTGDKFKERVQWAYALCFSRRPTDAESRAAQAYFSNFPSDFEKGSAGNSRSSVKTADANLAAWTGFCRALFASAEFRYLN